MVLATPLAEVKGPPAYNTPLLSTTMDETASSVPVPNALHAVPFHLAIESAAAIPLALEKYPPAYNTLPGAVANAVTSLFRLPIELDATPFHFAMCKVFTTPPAWVKDPPA